MWKVTYIRKIQKFLTALEHAYSCLMDILSTVKLEVAKPGHAWDKSNHAWDKPSLPMNLTYEVYCPAYEAYCRLFWTWAKHRSK
jgi:hypothetical protein